MAITAWPLANSSGAADWDPTVAAAQVERPASALSSATSALSAPPPPPPPPNPPPGLPPPGKGTVGGWACVPPPPPPGTPGNWPPPKPRKPKPPVLLGPADGVE